MKYLLTIFVVINSVAANFASAASDHKTVAKSFVGKYRISKKDCLANQHDFDIDENQWASLALNSENGVFFIDAEFKDEKVPPNRISLSEKEGSFKTDDKGNPDWFAYLNFTSPISKAGSSYCSKIPLSHDGGYTNEWREEGSFSYAFSRGPEGVRLSIERDDFISCQGTRVTFDSVVTCTFALLPIKD
ncbi:MAG: hypothetical protein ACXVBE_13760 [Bdellovibrionota bacterium]